MNSLNFNNQKGFIALISVIVIAAILAAITFVLSTSGFFLRFNVFDTESKKISLDVAEACVQTAMLELIQGAVPVLPQTVPVGTNSCKICYISSTNPSVNPKTIQTRAVSNDSYSNITVVLTQNPSSFTVNSWDEVSTYAGPGPACPIP